MSIADTSGLLALFNGREPRHAEVRTALSDVRAPLVVSPYVVAELAYLVGTRIGVTAELTVQYRPNRVLTLDRRHFDVLRTVEGKLFNLIP